MRLSERRLPTVKHSGSICIPECPENALREGSDGAGGYLVPDEYEDKLIEGLKEHNILRSLAHTIPTTHDLRIPVVLSNTTAQWVNESGDYPDTELCFGQTVISAYKVATSVLVSDELLEDSGIDLEDYILKENVCSHR